MTARRRALLPRIGALCAAALLPGCAVGPAYQAPQRELPVQWVGALPSSAAGTAQRMDESWWRTFGDPLLSRLVERALAANTDLRTARARLRAARAVTAIAAADRWPQVSASASAARSASGGAAPSSAYAVGFDASWEIDVFGGVRHAVEAAAADEQAAAAALASTRVSLAAEAARAYVEVRSLQARVAIARANLASQSETQQLAEWRAQSGLASSLDVEQARANRAQTAAQIPALEDSLAQQRHALALLLNEPPAALDRELAAGDGTLVPHADAGVALGIPADLMRRRPDVVAAERSFAAAAARVGVAQAARYPSLALSGSIGLQALSPGGLTAGDAASRSIAARFFAPIFDAGRLRQQVEVRDAEQEQALANYESTLLGAVRDVENALSSLATGRQRAAALAEATTAARNAAQLARVRYTSGVTDYQTVLDTERTLLSLQDSAATTDAANTTALIQLYKALGGGWSVGEAEAPSARDGNPQ